MSTNTAVRIPLGRVSAETLYPTPRHSAQQKAAYANALLSWISNGMPVEQFTRSNRLYDPLRTYLFGHIAHYNRWGFADEWFIDDQAKLAWLDYILTRPLSTETVGWNDVERAIVLVLQLGEYRNQFAAATGQPARDVSGDGDCWPW